MKCTHKLHVHAVQWVEKMYNYRLRRWPGAPPLTCADVWLLRVPVGAPLNGRVWALACTAAIAAMDHSRRALWRGVCLKALREGQALVQLAANKAVSHFWRLLQDFVLQGQIPEGWAAIPPEGGRPFRLLTLSLEQCLRCFVSTCRRNVSFPLTFSDLFGHSF